MFKKNKVGQSFKLIVPEEGMKYKALANGTEVIVTYKGSKRNYHCTTCTCVTPPIYELDWESEKQIGPGSYTIQILEKI